MATQSTAIQNYLKSLPKGVSHIRMSACPGGTLVQYFFQGQLIDKVIPPPRSKKK
jgi:hypothetical protein